VAFGLKFGVGVLVNVGVMVGVLVLVGVDVIVGVIVCVGVSEFVGVGVIVIVDVTVGVGVRVAKTSEVCVFTLYVTPVKFVVTSQYSPILDKLLKSSLSIT
jgi:hypothetical protein